MGLLDIKPHQVSRDLRGYSIMMYGTPKSGKTSTACRFPDHLLLAFEKGYAAIPGAMVQPINSWSEFKKTLRELEQPAVKEKFANIIIDTVDIAYEYCIKFICNQNNVDDINGIPYGKGYVLAMAEFDQCLRQIARLGYGAIIISHAQEVVQRDEKGEEYVKIMPTIDKRGRLVCERFCDIIGLTMPVADPTTGKQVSRMFMRETRRYVAGSRFRFTPDSIVLSYDNLAKAIADAIDKEAEEYGTAYVTETAESRYAVQEASYNVEAIRAECQQIISDLMGKSADNRPKISKILTEYLGVGKKLADVTESQAELLNSVLDELKRMNG